jgi:hypothetical protein
MQFVRDGYVYARSFGISRIGWFPGDIYPEGFGRPRAIALKSETCGIADMIALAIRLSNAGVGDFWEDVDQYVRNQLVEQQLIGADLMRSASEASPQQAARDVVRTGEEVIETIVGAFSDWAGLTHAGEPAGCCTGNGSQALYYAWEGMVRCEGGCARVNLLLNRASPWLDVDSYLPYEGKVVLKNKTAGTICVRIPYWVEKAAVRPQVNDAATSPSWLNNYLIISCLSPGDVVTISFPMVEATERYRVGDTDYTCQLKGNTLIDISPRDDRPTVYPTYLRGHYRSGVAPSKAQVRYVSPIAIQW